MKFWVNILLNLISSDILCWLKEAYNKIKVKVKVIPRLGWSLILPHTLCLSAFLHKIPAVDRWAASAAKATEAKPQRKRAAHTSAGFQKEKEDVKVTPIMCDWQLIAELQSRNTTDGIYSQRRKTRYGTVNTVGSVCVCVFILSCSSRREASFNTSVMLLPVCEVCVWQRGRHGNW